MYLFLGLYLCLASEGCRQVISFCMCCSPYCASSAYFAPRCPATAAFPAQLPQMPPTINNATNSLVQKQLSMVDKSTTVVCQPWGACGARPRDVEVPRTPRGRQKYGLRGPGRPGDVAVPEAFGTADGRSADIRNALLQDNFRMEV